MAKGPITKLNGVRKVEILLHQISSKSYMAPLPVNFSTVQKMAGRPQTINELFFIHFQP